MSSTSGPFQFHTRWLWSGIKVLIEKWINYRPHKCMSSLHLSFLRWKLCFSKVCFLKGVFFKRCVLERCVIIKRCVLEHTFLTKGVFFDKRCVHRTHLSITHQLHGVLINTPLWPRPKVCNRNTSFQRCVYDKMCSLTHHGVFCNTPWCVLIFTTHHGVF